MDISMHPLNGSYKRAIQAQGKAASIITGYFVAAKLQCFDIRCSLKDVDSNPMAWLLSDS